MKTLIFGSGPAGLIAAHSAVIQGSSVAIVSKEARKSYMKGAQYLHKPIPLVSGVPFSVNYKLRGKPEDYRRKVYGDVWDGTVSPEDLDEVHMAWDIREAYDKLWDVFGDSVTPITIEHASMVQTIIDKVSPDLTINTMPAPLLCVKNHDFQFQTIYSSDKDMIPSERGNVVICDGTDDRSWYRASRIHGWNTVEWPGWGPKPPFQPMWDVQKPLKTSCDCYPDVLRMGRYGKWTKGVLSHEAFDQTAAAIVSIKTRGIQEKLNVEA